MMRRMTAGCRAALAQTRFKGGRSATAVGRSNQMDQASPIPETPVPAGYPVGDTAILLLDETGQEVLAGDSGELAVKSCFLASGYWGRPEDTQAAFLPDPTGGGSRIF